jgi:hypothetical protein
LLNAAREDQELSALLSTKGYDAVKIAEGFSLLQAAYSAFIARQQALGAQKQATAKVREAEKAARLAYKDFRDTARSIFRDTSARTALGVNDAMPKEVETFMTIAGTSYAAALADPQYLAELARYGFPQTAIESARTVLLALAAANDAQELAKATATNATRQRDAAISALEQWLLQFKGIARVATRSRPDLACKLGL